VFVEFGVTHLNIGEVDTFTLGERDKRLLIITDHEDVGETGGESVTTGVLNVCDLVRTGVVLNVLENTDTTNVVTTSGKNSGTVIELNNTVDFTSCEVQLNSVVLLNVRVGEADSTAVVCNDVWHLILTDVLTDDLAKLEASFSILNTVGLEATLKIVQDAEVLTSLVDGDDVLEAEGELVVTAALAIDEDVGFAGFADLETLLLGEGVVETLTEEAGDWDALAEFVGTGAGTGGVNTTELVKAPVGGGEHALQVLFGTSGLQ